MEKLRVCHLFSGVGSPEMALDRLCVDYENVGFSEIDKFAIQSYKAIHGEQPYLGGIEEIEALPKCDLLIYGSPCLTGDTLVLTSLGYKQIVDINVGDDVVGHDGKFHKVTHLLNQGIKPTYKIKAMGMDSIRCTNNHKFYVRKLEKVWNNEKRKYERHFDKPEWVECKDLNKFYYMGMPINNKSELPVWNGVEYGRWKHQHNELPLDNIDFWYIVGRFVGDGWVRDRKDRNCQYSSVIICCGKSEIDDLENKIKIFNYTKVVDRTTYKLQIYNKEFATFLSNFGHGASEKLIPSFVMNLPKDLLKSFINGYLESDGCYTQNNYKGTSISKKLIYGLTQCVAKVYNRPFSIYHNKRKPTCIIEGREVNQKDLFDFTFHVDARKQDKAFYEDGYIWYPIQTVESTGLEEPVFDITVDECHSFVANNCITHNCTDFSIAGGMKGLIDEQGNKTRSGLLLDVERLLDTAKESNELPKYLIMENVKNLVGKKFMPDFQKWLNKLDELGYNNYWKVLNAKDYGIPQNRERVFVISIRKDIDTEGYTFPEPFKLDKRLKDLLEDEVEEHYYLNQHTVDKIVKSKFHSERDRIVKGDICQTLRARDFKDPVCVTEPITGATRTRYTETGEPYQNLETTGEPISNTLTTVASDALVIEPKVMQVANYLEGEGNYWKNPNNGRIYSGEGLAPTLNCMEGGNRQPKVILNGEEIKVRKLTERECWRLMGFSDESVNKVKAAGISRSQMYKQAGNSIVTDVLYYILKKLLDK